MTTGATNDALGCRRYVAGVSPAMLFIRPNFWIQGRHGERAPGGLYTRIQARKKPPGLQNVLY